MAKIKYPHVSIIRPAKHPGHVQPVLATRKGFPYQLMKDPDGSYSIFTDDNEGRREARAYGKRWLKNANAQKV